MGEEREYAKDRMEYFKEFHEVVAPPVVRIKIEPEIDDGEEDEETVE